MAKKGSREYVTLECKECKGRNYRTSKQTKSRGSKNQVEKRHCQNSAVHVENILHTKNEKNNFISSNALHRPDRFVYPGSKKRFSAVYSVCFLSAK